MGLKSDSYNMNFKNWKKKLNFIAVFFGIKNMAREWLLKFQAANALQSRVIVDYLFFRYLMQKSRPRLRLLNCEFGLFLILEKIAIFFSNSYFLSFLGIRFQTHHKDQNGDLNNRDFTRSNVHVLHILCPGQLNIISNSNEKSSL